MYKDTNAKSCCGKWYYCINSRIQMYLIISSVCLGGPMFYAGIMILYCKYYIKNVYDEKCLIMIWGSCVLNMTLWLIVITCWLGYFCHKKELQYIEGDVVGRRIRPTKFP